MEVQMAVTNHTHMFGTRNKLNDNSILYCP